MDPLLNMKVKVVFIGTKPGAKSEEVGHYYANPNNSFYTDLKDGGWTDRVYRYDEDLLLLEDKNIGLDDVYHDKYALISRLEPYQPPIVCFNSKGALEVFSGRRIRGSDWAGAGASACARFPWEPKIWALYDSSGMASRYHEKRIDLLGQLLTYVQRTG